MTNEKIYIKILFYIFYIYLAFFLLGIWLTFYTTDPGMGNTGLYSNENVFTLMSTPPLFISVASIVVLFSKNVNLIQIMVFFYIILLANRVMGVTLFSVNEGTTFSFILEGFNFLGNLFFYLRLRNK
tara:strand:+ start:149 stop:529 length:381 start_codon:yes stop_codon:yes gene_type:complete